MNTVYEVLRWIAMYLLVLMLLAWVNAKRDWRRRPPGNKGGKQ